MNIERLAIPEVLLITPPRFGDARGFFSETFNAKKLREATGIEGAFVQDNHSLSRPEAASFAACTASLPPYSGQARALRARRNLGRGGGCPRRLADLREMGRRRAFGRELAAALDSRRLPAWLLHARAGYRGGLQSHRRLRQGERSGRDLERPRSRFALARRSDEVVLSDKDKLLPRLRDAGTLFTY